jgi:hypothetical protein
MNEKDLVFIPLIIGEASGVFAGFCPSWFTVSSPFFHEQEAKKGNVKRIRWGEVAATAIVMATGVAISYHTSSKIPFVVSALTCGVFVGGYEYMIANPSAEDADSDGLPQAMKSALNWKSAR